MLNTSADNLIRERDEAEKHKRQYIDHLDQRIRRLHGPAFQGSGPQSVEHQVYDPENVYYQYASLMNPRLAQEPFEIKLTTRYDAGQELVARALRHAVMRWSRDTSYQELREEVATDFNVQWAVLMTTLGPAPGYEEHDDPVLWPHVSRVSPHDFGWDPLAKSRNTCRYFFHRVVEDKDTLLQRARGNQEEGWNEDAIQGLGENVGVDKLEREKHVTIDRDEVVYYVFWIPEKTLEKFPDDRKGSPSSQEGYHGTLYYVAETQEGSDSEAHHGVFIRDPQPYYGPRWGPYSWFGGMYVTDTPAPLSALVAVETQVREYNALVRAINRADRAYKRLILVDSSHPKLAQIIKSSPHDFVVPVRGLNTDQVIQFEIGGSTQQMHVGAQNARTILERALGLDEAMRGNVSGEGTATEHSIAAEAGARRVQHPVNRFRRGELQTIKTVAWYLYHTDEVVVPLDSAAAEELGIDAPLFLGGGLEGEGSGASFDDLGLEIDVVPEGLDQRRMMEFVQFVLSTAPSVPQTPWMNWREIYDTAGQINQVSNGSRFIDFDAAQQMAQVMLQMGIVGEGDTKEPRTGRDLGASGIVRHAAEASGSRTEAEPAEPQTTGA